LLWFGPKGTVTPLHHDTENVFLCQVFGRKRVVLFPRFELPILGVMPNSVYSPIDMGSPEGEVFPELAGALRTETVLSPGEALFIPVGCFHQMRALDVSISLGFSNFRAKNQFTWYTPGRLT
jgi:ribosomal protein L16 Arg81 hydroxylase